MIFIVHKCNEGIMQFANHFREPAAGVSRCEYKIAVSCLSRFPEEMRINSSYCVGKSGLPRYQGKVLYRAPMSGCFYAANLGGTAIRNVFNRPGDSCKHESPGFFVFIKQRSKES